jgi:uncharacterized membrane protein
MGPVVLFGIVFIVVGIVMVAIWAAASGVRRLGLLIRRKLARQERDANI